MRSFGRFLAIFLLWTVTWWLVLGSLLHPLLPGGWLTVLGAAIVGTAPLLAMIRNRTGNGYPSALKRLLVVHPFWYVQLFLPLLAISGLAGALAGLPFGESGLAGRWALAVAAASLAVLGLVGYATTRWLRVRPLEVRLDDLPPGLEGLRIAQISDLHVGPHTSRRFLARIAAAVHDARPDLIAVTGDQVDDYARDVESFAAAFRGLSAPLGVFAIPGNHDVYAGWTAVREGLEAMGMKVLVNRAIPLERNGSRFWLAGTGDPAGRGGSAVAPDIARTLAIVPPDSFTIALAHNPALWPALAQRGVELTLSGHTHYGQLAFPRLGWSLASPFVKHAMGMHRQNGSILYINPGTNYWGIPFRIGTRPEVTVLTLRRRCPRPSSPPPLEARCRISPASSSSSRGRRFIGPAAMLKLLAHCCGLPGKVFLQLFAREILRLLIDPVADGTDHFNGPDRGLFHRLSPHGRQGQSQRAAWPVFTRRWLSRSRISRTRVPSAGGLASVLPAPAPSQSAGPFGMPVWA